MSFVRLANALLALRGWERKQRLVSEGTAFQTERSSHARNSAGVSEVENR